MRHYAGPEACTTQDATRDATFDRRIVNCPECIGNLFKAAGLDDAFNVLKTAGLDDALATLKSPESPRPSKGNLVEMGVTVTLVFSDEAHREAWLRRMGLLDEEGKRTDYERRRHAQNLTFLVGAEYV